MKRKIGVIRTVEMRGGSWFTVESFFLEASNRNRGTSTYPYDVGGFRLVRCV